MGCNFLFDFSHFIFKNHSHCNKVHSCFQVIDLDNEITKSRSNDSVSKTQIHSGTLDENTMNSTNLAKSSKSSDIDWSQPFNSSQMNSTSGGGGGGGFDWSQPVSSNITQTADALDWGAPVSKFEEDELKLDWGDDDAVNGVDDDCDTKSDSEVERQDKLKGPSVEVEDGGKSQKPELIMVRQIL